MKKPVLFFVTVLWLLAGYGQQKAGFGAGDYVHALKQATDVMVNDVTSPVAAARYYSYINLAANETVALLDKQQPQFAGVLKGWDGLTAADPRIKKADAGLAALFALYKTAVRLLPSGSLLRKNIDSLATVAAKQKIPAEKIGASIAVADKVVEQVLRYAAADGFVKLSGLRKFTPVKGDAYWQPTGPGFMAAVEPHWHTLRTFVLDSCSQFAVAPPATYSTDTTSAFYQQLKEVYEVGKNLTEEQAAIAMFWDCNPFALQQVGHLEFGIKKISPGGHWMGITGIACKKNGSGLARTAYVHTLVALGMADAFISCWNNKYRYSRVRPVTAIQKLLDRTWNPLLQTPPFPEYTSGHSVISTTASVILTHLFGEDFSFTDDTEEEFGLPARTFRSFSEAAKEAAISRLYGGIHFRDAIENGVKEGEQIGQFVLLQSPEGQTKTGNSKRVLAAHVKTKTQ